MYRIFYRARKVVLKSQPKYHYMIRTDSLIGSKYDPNKEYQMFLAVNEQNPQAKGFYEHIGFQVWKRTDCDEQGKPYPLIYMKLN